MLVFGLFWAKEPIELETEIPFNSLFLETRNEPIDYLQIVEKEYLISKAPPFLISDETYGTLIDCLIYHESGGNKWAVGKANEKGILQFMPQTFREFCVERYNYKNDIWSVEIQRLCCDQMIEDGYAHLWTTYKFCNRGGLTQ